MVCKTSAKNNRIVEKFENTKSFHNEQEQDQLCPFVSTELPLHTNLSQ